MNYDTCYIFTQFMKNDNLKIPTFDKLSWKERRAIKKARKEYLKEIRK